MEILFVTMACKVKSVLLYYYHAQHGLLSQFQYMREKLT